MEMHVAKMLHKLLDEMSSVMCTRFQPLPIKLFRKILPQWLRTLFPTARIVKSRLVN